MRLKKTLLGLIFGFSLLLLIISASAATGQITDLFYGSLNPNSPTCDNAYITNVHDAFYQVNDALGYDYVAIVDWDSNGDWLSGLITAVKPVDQLYFGYSVPLKALRPIPPGPVTAVLYDEPDVNQGDWHTTDEFYQWLRSHGTVLDTATLAEPPGGWLQCNTPTTPGDDDQSSAPFNPNDGRLNTDPGAIMAFYAPSDGSIKIYGIDAESHGHLSIYLTPEDLAALPDNPAENTLIRVSDDGRVALYKLTTGEYQVNAGPDSDGKVVVYVFGGDPLAWLSLTDFNVNAPP